MRGKLGLWLKVHPDNGTELKNEDVAWWRERKGVKWTHRCFYGPQQNG